MRPESLELTGLPGALTRRLVRTVPCVQGCRNHRWKFVWWRLWPKRIASAGTSGTRVGDRQRLLRCRRLDFSARTRTYSQLWERLSMSPAARESVASGWPTEVWRFGDSTRSEEHTSELQSQFHLV